jgi:hypothetical protein
MLKGTEAGGSRPAFRLERSSPIPSMVPGWVVERLVRLSIEGSDPV